MATPMTQTLHNNGTSGATTNVDDLVAKLANAGISMEDLQVYYQETQATPEDIL